MRVRFSLVTLWGSFFYSQHSANVGALRRCCWHHVRGERTPGKGYGGDGGWGGGQAENDGDVVRGGVFLLLFLFCFCCPPIRWSTQHIEHKDRVGMQAQGSFVFWWWQYLWLSVIAMVPYALEALQQIFPVCVRVCVCFCASLGWVCVVFFPGAVCFCAFVSVLIVLYYSWCRDKQGGGGKWVAFFFFLCVRLFHK